MPFQKLQFRPGINRDVTSFTNQGGWEDCDKIRFFQGFPEKIGGWEKYSGATFLGTCRSLHNWVSLDSNDYLGVGTHLKFYIESGTVFNDITPLRKTTTGTATFAAVNGSSTLTITDASHDALPDDFVTFSSATSLGGNIIAAVLNQEYQIVSVSGNDYTIVAKDTSGDTVTANSSDSGNGGGSTVAKYQITVGLDTVVGGTGFGAGTFGRGTFGSAAALGVGTELRLWSQDNFGEDLLINVRDGAIYRWDKTNGLGVRAVELSTLTGASDTPTVAKQILVSDTDRHVLAFGTNAQGASAQDDLLIRFSDQESAVDWTATATNTAGDLRLGVGSTFVKAIQTKREILVWTDMALHSMRFIGPPFTFGLQQLASNITIAGTNAAIAVEDVALWMGLEAFYIYSGQTQQLPCTVIDRVFGDFSLAEREKTFAGVNSKFGEVFWFYCSLTNSLASGGDGENDRYVVYNYNDKVWYYGNLERTAWIDRGVRTYPIAAKDSLLYNHELGLDDDGSALSSFIQSSQVNLGEGDQFVSVMRMIPDVSFTGSTTGSPSVDLTVATQDFPGAVFADTSTDAVTRSGTSSTVPFEQFTNKVDLRLRGRAFGIKLSSSEAGVNWRFGSPRLDIRPDGRR